MHPEAIHAPPGYEFVRHLGSGGFGSVYLARQRSIDRLVAIKEIAPHALADPDNVERFRREARVLAATSVASVIKVFDVNTRHDPAYLVMEYVPGGTLADRLAKGPLPAARAIPVLGDVAHALRSMARLGLVHRDIKPDNVFVTPEGRAKLGDFGLARALVDDTAFRTAGGVPIGTPAYFPPEVSQGHREPDHQSDAYSFGVMAYEALTGRLPYDAPDAISMITAHWHQTPRHPAEALPGIPRAAADALLAGLAKQPGGRPLPHELVAALQAIPAQAWPTLPYSQPEPVSSPDGLSINTSASEPPSRPLPPRRPAPRSRGRRIALSVGALVTIGAAAAGVRLLEPWSGTRGLDVRNVSLDALPRGSAPCPSAVQQFVATVSTNGAPGVLTIAWIRPDGEEVPAKTVVMDEGQRTVRAELTYTFRGTAPREGRAVVRVGGDDVGRAVRSVSYVCPSG